MSDRSTKQTGHDEKSKILNYMVDMLRIKENPVLSSALEPCGYDGPSTSRHSNAVRRDRPLCDTCSNRHDIGLCWEDPQNARLRPPKWVSSKYRKAKTTDTAQASLVNESPEGKGSQNSNLDDVIDPRNTLTSDWVLDFKATTHMSGKRHYFTNMVEKGEWRDSRIADQSDVQTAEIPWTGEVTMKDGPGIISLSGVLYRPGMASVSSVISVSKLRENGCQILIRSQSAEVITITGSRIKFMRRSDGCFSKTMQDYFRGRPSDWIFSSEVTYHMTGNRDFFGKLSRTGLPENVGTAAQSSLRSWGIGSITIRSERSLFTIRDVLYVPELGSSNVFSLSKLREQGCEVIILDEIILVTTDNCARMYFPRTQKSWYERTDKNLDGVLEEAEYVSVADLKVGSVEASVSQEKYSAGEVPKEEHVVGAVANKDHTKAVVTTPTFKKLHTVTTTGNSSVSTIETPAVAIKQSAPAPNIDDNALITSPTASSTKGTDHFQSIWRKQFATHNKQKDL